MPFKQDDFLKLNDLMDIKHYIIHINELIKSTKYTCIKHGFKLN